MVYIIQLNIRKIGLVLNGIVRHFAKYDVAKS
jgi:hypothetical protein